MPMDPIEERRLAALAKLGILDTPPEERFDRRSASGLRRKTGWNPGKPTVLLPFVTTPSDRKSPLLLKMPAKIRVFAITRW